MKSVHKGQQQRLNRVLGDSEREFIERNHKSFRAGEVLISCSVESIQTTSSILIFIDQNNFIYKIFWRKTV